MKSGAEPCANLVEVFSGIQGEGPLVGYRQIFVRFASCNLRCRYCDTRKAWSIPKFCRLEQEPGRRDWRRRGNPLGLGALGEAVARLARPHLHHSVALTGGEPLLQADFLAEFLPALRAMGLRAFLETNGTLPEALEKIVEHLDYIAMDIKLASASGEEMPEAAHREFLRCGRRRSICVKIVVTGATTAAELATAAKLVAEVDPCVPVILQPVTPTATVSAPTPEQVLLLQESLTPWLREVRVIPQTHKLMGQK